MKSLLYVAAAIITSFFLKGLLKGLGFLKPARPPLPPGPKGWPLIGNYLDIPKTKEWLNLDKWFKEHGDIVYYQLFGKGILALGSLNRCHEIFEKRSSIYSSRPGLIMLNKLSGWDFALVTLPYGSTWRKHRQAFHQYFNMNVAPKYRSMQLKGARGLLRQLLDCPDHDALRRILRSSFAEIIMETVYGYEVAPVNDPYMEITELAATAMLECLTPGRFLVEVLPLLQYIPSWLPGAEFKRLAAKWKAATIAMDHGTAKPSVVTSMTQRISDQEESGRDELEKVLKNTAGVAFAGGTDTTMSAVTVFFLTMAMHPEAQKKAQAEIDSVIGSHRLPDFSDRDSLPYVNAILKETLRWQTIVPLSKTDTPHLSTQDDVYDGYFIPKGTIIIGGSWTILHDPAVYPDPFEFKPERFIKNGKIDPDVLDPYVAIFGYGRRVCPGRYFADDTAYIMIVSILASLNISAPLDENGRPKQLICDMDDGIVSFPKPFDCDIKPRSKVATELIRDSIMN
ncbi:hypothetical protein M422DRAFT_273670 [Sphaerobolus stellatus SS14]|uniref:Cytochrome P450 n=1 Tax=Sphaerobolus stellatus (strain SS14) TaxID=990650 RepID=A0A0C9TU73_SPHS4|nr:hypothetical protein M422DRAFT_273670 [Sphaerobolus stellatus SS14]